MILHRVVYLLLYNISLIVEIARGARRNDDRRTNGNDR
jgi:hypothetical protein